MSRRPETLADGWRCWSAARIRGAAVAVALLSVVLPGCRDRPPPNIVLIVIDTLRADHLGCYGYHRPTSPHIDRLAAAGTLFERAHSVAAYTRPSTASILTGVYPSVHGAVTHADAISASVPTLAERLKDAGYSTTGFHRNGNVSDKFGFGRGFDTYLAVDKPFWRGLKAEWRKSNPEGKFREQTHYVSETDDSILTGQAVPFLRDVERSPFFLYLHLAGPHDPYTPPPDAPSFLDAPLTPTAERFYRQPVKSQVEKGSVLEQMRRGLLPVDELTRKQLVDLYDGEVAHSDRQIGAILDALVERGLTGDTLVVLTADHGEELWDHDDLGHGHSNYQELLHVPLVIAGPGVRSRRIAEPVSLIDLTPTILDLAGLEVPENLAGKSLAAVVKSSRQRPPATPVYAESMVRLLGTGDPLFFRSVLDGNLKLILDFARERKLLFDLEADAGERTNRIAELAGEGRGLLDTLIEIHDNNLESPLLAPIEAVDIPPELEENLRALGYLGSASDSSPEPLFRQPLRRLDLEAYGFLGHERDGGRYRSALDFSNGEYPAEQLLYGWWPERAGAAGRDLVLRAGVRLKRDADQDSWRLEGRRRGGGLTLDVRVDGGEPRSFDLPAREAFTIGGPLPAGSGSFVRLDLECKPPVDRDRRSHPETYCLTAHHLGLEGGTE